MGFGSNDRGATKTYINVRDDYFWKQASSDDIRAKKIELEDGRTFYELRTQNISGFITAFKCVEREVTINGKAQNKLFLEIEFLDAIEADATGGIEYFILSMFWDSRAARGILCRVANVDPSEKTEISIWTNKEGKVFTTMRTYDAVGRKRPIAPAYTRDEPNGRPPCREVLVNGSRILDRTDETNFYRDVVEAWTNAVNPELAEMLATPAKM